MKISVELTLLPLQNDFEDHIKAFIIALRASEFTILENPLSTQVYGDFDKVIPFLTHAIKTTFKNTKHVVVNMKIVKTDRSSYEPTF